MTPPEVHMEWRALVERHFEKWQEKARADGPIMGRVCDLLVSSAIQDIQVDSLAIGDKMLGIGKEVDNG